MAESDLKTCAARLESLGIVLPQPAAPLAAYVPWVVEGNLLLISGQLPMENGRVRYTGKVGAELDLEAGVAAARLCAINILAQAQAACGGDLERLGRCLRLAGFVSAGPGFIDHPKVINGASELMLAVLGDAGRHARAAVGVSALPLDAAVEIEAMFSLKP